MDLYQRRSDDRGMKTFPVLAILFISCYFLFFSGGSLGTYFTFDDGMNLVALHRHWEVPLYTSVLDVLKVFTPAYRPLGALFYRPLYNLFGFNPLPFRIVAYLLMILNILLAFRFARALEATGEACALSTLLFCYNGSMQDLYYNTGTIYDLMCFPLYIGAVLLYVRRRSRSLPLDFPTMSIVMILFLAALDAKEMAVTLPLALLIYEVLYRYRDHASRQTLRRSGGFLLLMFAAAAAFLKIKVADLSGNALYHPHLSPGFILTGMGHYFEQLLYLRPGSFGPAKVVIALGALLAVAAALRSRAAAFGTLFFAVGLLPLAVIGPRTGYAAYVAYPGFTLALAVILTSARSALMRVIRKPDFELAGMVALFLLVAAISIESFAHTRKILISNALWDEQRRIDLFTGLKREISEFPPNARILLVDDVWGPDWGPMFLTRLLYHNPGLWLDRVRNPADIVDRDSYDLLISYQQPLQNQRSPRIFGVRETWETHWFPYRKGEFTVTAPNENRAIRNIAFSPSSIEAGQAVTVAVPGLSNGKIDAIYRIVSGVKSITYSVDSWCALDSTGTGTIVAPSHVGKIARFAIDWVRPSKGRWIFAHGELALTQASHPR